MNGKLLLLVCAVVMLFLTGIRRMNYGISLLKWIPITVLIAILGLLGTYIMFFLENGKWYGQSFFGAVLFFPILLLPVAAIFCIPIADLLDYATPAGIALLAPFKLNCYLGGCCGGKVLFFDENGIATHFPSQIVEMVVAIVLTIVLMHLERKPSFRRKIYPICIIAYGVIRYFLNFFRVEQTDFLFSMPAGNLWSLVSVVMGILLLVFCRTKKS